MILVLMSLMNPLGTMMGFVIPFAFVNPDDSQDLIKEGFMYHMLSQAIAASGVALLVILFFKGDKELTKTKVVYESPREASHNSIDLAPVNNINQ